ncbi:hypothetical protein [Pseudoalteromonas sp. S2893]|nr:hypothetical protein [Pseudoalteromonas sp. S2893]
MENEKLIELLHQYKNNLQEKIIFCERSKETLQQLLEELEKLLNGVEHER